MPAFSRDLLVLIDGAEEVDVETHRTGGRVRRTIIWIVVADGHPYVRSIKGADGLWYREMRADDTAVFHVDDRLIPVTASPVTDTAEIARVTDAFRQKYGRSPYLNGVVKPESLSGTLRLAVR